MGLHTIRQVSADFSVSTRTLRYYEQIGLLRSVKIDAYAYRAYDEEAIARLQQVLVLRKLRISLKQIATILRDRRRNHCFVHVQDNLGGARPSPGPGASGKHQARSAGRQVPDADHPCADRHENPFQGGKADGRFGQSP